MPFKLEFRPWPQSADQIQYSYVPWDSEIFGFPFYTLLFSDGVLEPTNGLRSLLDFLAEQSRGQCLVFTKIASIDVTKIQGLVGHGFYQVETSLEPYRNLRSFEPGRRFERLRLRPATDTDKPSLLDIANKAFSTDRYHLDPNLPNERANFRYEYWLDRGIQSGDPVYVYEDSANGKQIGFFHVRKDTEGVIDLSLAAIDPELQRGGFGLLMYSECLSECKRLGFKQAVTRISVNNIAVLNIYAHLGFAFRNPRSTWHWYADWDQKLPHTSEL